MAKIKIIFGPNTFFQKQIPENYIPLEHYIRFTDSLTVNIFKEFDYTKVEDYLSSEIVVAETNAYSSIKTGAVQNFKNILDLLFDYSDGIFLQNPPKNVLHMIRSNYKRNIDYEEILFRYKNINVNNLKKINRYLRNNIVGQDSALDRVMANMYSLTKNKKSKPIVLMLYGASGVGKTETAKIISNVMGGGLVRKQMSMSKSNQSFSYTFGSSHDEPSLAKDLIQRETNIVLFDEFDKAHPEIITAFYQLFDEGVFEDSNYLVEMHNSIIICTSNYRNENEIRSALGDPIYFRFDDIIFYNDLTLISKQILIERIFENRWKLLTEKEIKFLGNKEDLLDKYLSYGNQLKNFRHIDNLIKQDLNLTLFKRIISDNS
ncbi:AAA family ATPase [Enterococcus gallinarum]|uniref:AAA family ATPase n=1 Tax=Enterococcus gallinarum TaxID=1353 RepID=UPI001F042957|nr:AAA family ATPase [Enterococcus gallinarum]